MDIEGHVPSPSPLSRRAMLGTLGAGAVGLAAAVALPGVAAAGPEGGEQATGGSQAGGAGLPGGGLTAGSEIVAGAGPSPVQEGLDYVLVAGWEIEPLTSVQKWERFDNAFRFTGTASSDKGYALIPMQLPVGAVVKEVELYGTTATGSASSLEIWTNAVTSVSATRLRTVSIPVNAGPFTVTAAVDIVLSTTAPVRAFVNINDTVAAATKITGARIGYIPLPAFVALDPIPRPYNTRDTPGLTKLAGGEERTIQLPVPAGISAAVVQLTVTETGPAGFIGVFPADAPAWPGNSSINWFAANSNVGNTVLAAVSPDGKIKIRSGGSDTHVIIDVPGILY